MNKQVDIANETRKRDHLSILSPEARLKESVDNEYKRIKEVTPVVIPEETREDDFSQDKKEEVRIKKDNPLTFMSQVLFQQREKKKYPWKQQPQQDRQDRSRQTTTKVQVKKPIEIACMSRNNARDWIPGCRKGLPKYFSPPIPCDLNVGFEEFKETYIDEHPESLRNILMCLTHNSSQTCIHNVKPHFVTWRGNLTKILCHPYSLKDGFAFGVWKVNNVIYISNRETEAKLEQDRLMDDKAKRFMYYGYKYEETATRDQGQTMKHNSVNTNVCFGSVFKTTVGKHCIVAGAEMDCYEEDKTKPASSTSCVNDSYIELKVTKLLHSSNDVRSFERYKLLKWYFQSFMAGVPKIIVGFRTYDGTLQKTQVLDTLHIPQMIQGREAELWDKNICIKFLDELLSWLAGNCSTTNRSIVEEGKMYELAYHGTRGSSITLSESTRRDIEVIDPELYL